MLIESGPDYSTNTAAIWQYHLIDNVWSKLLTYSHKMITTVCDGMFDEHSQSVYICDLTQLYQVDIKTKQMNFLFEFGVKDSLAPDVQLPMIFLNHDYIHLITKQLTKYPEHHIFTKKGEPLQTLGYPVHDFLSKSTVFMKKRNSIITIASKNDAVTIYEFHFENYQWIKWNIQGLNNLFRNCQIISNSSEQFLIILKYPFMADEIFFIDVRKQKLFKSLIKIPEYLSNRRIIGQNDQYRDDLLVFAYINQFWKLPKYSNIPLLPFYLIKLIGKWVCFEWINIFGSTAFSRDIHHWQINVDEIVCNYH